MDILQWANDNTLPFLSLGALSKPLLEQLNAASLGFPLPLLEPSGVDFHGSSLLQMLLHVQMWCTLACCACSLTAAVYNAHEGEQHLQG